MSSSLEHIAFVLDGNRRWAASHGLPFVVGHRSGYARAKEFATILPKYGIKYATYHVFSTENWNRSKEEVDYLMKMFYDFFCDADDFVMKYGIRVVLIGDLEKLPNNILEKAKYVE
ncbi:MAG: undecaprenyl diphosphate synthase family protein, partial [Holosporaceae bacterium]|nr:undecaprenyl diphosphate synthase family protein [Holosporaceae bacterium]